MNLIKFDFNFSDLKISLKKICKYYFVFCFFLVKQVSVPEKSIPVTTTPTEEVKPPKQENKENSKGDDKKKDKKKANKENKAPKQAKPDGLYFSNLSKYRH